MTEENHTTETPMQEGQQQEGPTGLSINDLSTLKQVIDVASQRGAFKPNEMVAVGQVYTKLDEFLSQVSNQQNQ